MPRTVNPDHMRANDEINFETLNEDMRILENVKPLDYGNSSGFPEFCGKLY
ncbi:hypothetical protein PET01_02380 [Pediococcus ethanolidurans]|nr:hypothetical protein PET01_02380 [Pediococcus ethanolidurans]